MCRLFTMLRWLCIDIGLFIYIFTCTSNNTIPLTPVLFLYNHDTCIPLPVRLPSDTSRLHLNVYLHDTSRLLPARLPLRFLQTVPISSRLYLYDDCRHLPVYLHKTYRSLAVLSILVVPTLKIILFAVSTFIYIIMYTCSCTYTYIYALSHTCTCSCTCFNTIHKNAIVIFF